MSQLQAIGEEIWRTMLAACCRSVRVGTEPVSVTTPFVTSTFTRDALGSWSESEQDREQCRPAG